MSSNQSISADVKDNGSGQDKGKSVKKYDEVEGEDVENEEQESDYSEFESQESYEEDKFDEDPTLFIPDVDQRNIGLPQYVPMIAERCVIAAQSSTDYLNISTELFSKAQSTLTSKEHELALQWMIRAFFAFHFPIEALYQGVFFLNTFLCKNNVDYDELQLVSTVCLFLAFKMERNISLPLSSICALCNNKITEQQIMLTEPKIILCCDCIVQTYSQIYYIKRFLSSIDCEDSLGEVAYFFSLVALSLHVVINFAPTVVALSCVILAKICMNEFCPIQRLINFSHLKEVTDINSSCRLIMNHAEFIITRKYGAVYEQYASCDFLEKLVFGEYLLDF